MIVFDLECLVGGHRFEGWFASSTDFSRQQDAGLLACPQCGSSDIVKAVMAPNVARKGNQLAVAKPAGQTQPVSKGALPPEAAEMVQALAKLQAQMLKNSRWVGESLAEESRAMHYGERDVAVIHGQATLAEAKALSEEGIEVAMLPFPVAPPKATN